MVSDWSFLINSGLVKYLDFNDLMRKLLIPFMLLLTAISAYSQTGEPRRSLTEVHHRWGVSALQINDPYLSILQYSGLGGRFEYSGSRFLNPEKARVSGITRFAGLGGLTINPESTAAILYVGGTASWGMQYHLKPSDDILIKAGANLEALYGYKQNTRNVNNPVNLDIAANINATFTAKYQVHTKRRTITLNADFEVPMLGVMAVLPPGMTYWELSKSEDYLSVLHLTNLRNRQGSRETYWMDFPMKYSTWSLGLRTNSLKYIVDDHLYNFLEYGVFIGVTYDFIRFSGRKRPSPDIFISPKF